MASLDAMRSFCRSVCASPRARKGPPSSRHSAAAKVPLPPPVSVFMRLACVCREQVLWDRCLQLKSVCSRSAHLRTRDASWYDASWYPRISRAYPVSASESSSAGACMSLCRGDDREVMKLRADFSGSGGSTVGTDSLGEGVLFNRGYAHEGSIEALWDDHHNDGHGSFRCEEGGLDDGSEEVPLDVIKGGGGGVWSVGGSSSCAILGSVQRLEGHVAFPIAVVTYAITPVCVSVVCAGMWILFVGKGCGNCAFYLHTDEGERFPSSWTLLRGCRLSCPLARDPNSVHLPLASPAHVPSSCFCEPRFL